MSCKAVQKSDSMVCDLCELQWDVNDHSPPTCLEGKKKSQAFEEAARPLIKWMAENVHPHHTTVVTATGAELLEGQCSTGQILDYVKG